MTRVNLNHINGGTTIDALSGLLLAKKINETFVEDKHLYLSIKALEGAYIVPFLKGTNDVWYYVKTLIDADAQRERRSMLHKTCSNIEIAHYLYIWEVEGQETTNKEVLSPTIYSMSRGALEKQVTIGVKQYVVTPTWLTMFSLACDFDFDWHKPVEEIIVAPIEDGASMTHLTLCWILWLPELSEVIGLPFHTTTTPRQVVHNACALEFDRQYFSGSLAGYTFSPCLELPNDVQPNAQNLDWTPFFKVQKVTNTGIE